MGQEKAPINCNRPHDNAKTLPFVSLIPFLADFMTTASHPSQLTQDKTFLNQFVEAMSKMYDKEKDRQTAVLDLFWTIGIVMHPTKVIGTDYMTDGDSFFRTFLQS